MFFFVKCGLFNKIISRYIYPSRRQSRGNAFTSCVCMFFRILSQKPMRFVSPNDLMFNNEFWKTIYYEVKVTSHKSIAELGLCTLVSAGFFYFVITILEPILNRVAISIRSRTKKQRISRDFGCSEGLVSWLLTSVFSTNIAISETIGHGWRAIPTQ